MDFINLSGIIALGKVIFGRLLMPTTAFLSLDLRKSCLHPDVCYFCVWKLVIQLGNWGRCDFCLVCVCLCIRSLQAGLLRNARPAVAFKSVLGFPLWRCLILSN